MTCLMQTFSLLGLEPGVVGEMIIVGDGELEDDGDEGVMSLVVVVMISYLKEKIEACTA